MIVAPVYLANTVYHFLLAS